MPLRRLMTIVVATVAVVSIACSGAPAAPSESEPVLQTPIAEPTSVLIPTPTSTPSPEPTSTSVPPQSPPSNTGRQEIVSNPDAPTRLTRNWPNTDFNQHSVPFFEIISGGVPRDGIPPIDSPAFVNVSDNTDYMEDDDPVIALEINGEAKAYPLDILQGHEIVNDDLNGRPVTITYCPLCNTAIVFDRVVDGTTLDFGVSGNLRNSDLIMWDRQTESWWQQVTGEAIVGEMTGTQLDVIPAPVISWMDFREGFPDGQLLSRESAGRFRDYDNAPYDGYDDLNSEIPFLFMNDYDLEGIRGGEDPEIVIGNKIDDRLLPMERVVSLKIGGQAVAYPFMFLQQSPVVNDTIGSQDIVVFYVGETLSAFQGSQGAANRIVGSTGVYEPFVNGDKLSFRVEDGTIVDESTGSKWNILGRAVEGSLAGTELEPIAHANHFWFAWAAFNPGTEVREPNNLAE